MSASTPQPTGAKTDTPVIQATPELVGCEKWRAIVNRYDWDKKIAMAIMQAESGCNNTSKGDDRVIGGIHAPSCGLFQIRTLAGRPSCEQLYDPETNVAWAYRLHQARGWQPWSVFNNGMYKQYL